jgi:hypothetical protein
LRLLGSESLPAIVLIDRTSELIAERFFISKMSLLKIIVKTPLLVIEAIVALSSNGFVFKFLFEFFLKGLLTNNAATSAFI